jgi:hypothetical protein
LNISILEVFYALIFASVAKFESVNIFVLLLRELRIIIYLKFIISPHIFKRFRRSKAIQFCYKIISFSR